MSVDPVTTDVKTGDHFNRYVYGENNPYKFKDPDGRQATSVNNEPYQAPLAPLYQMLKSTFGGGVERAAASSATGGVFKATLTAGPVEVSVTSKLDGSGNGTFFAGFRFPSSGLQLQTSVEGQQKIGDTNGFTAKVSASGGLGYGLTGSASVSGNDSGGGLQFSGGGAGAFNDKGGIWGVRPPAVTLGYTAPIKLPLDQNVIPTR